MAMADSAADQGLFRALEEFQVYPFTEDPGFRIGLAVLLKKRVPRSTSTAEEKAQLPELTEEDLNRTDDFVTNLKLFYFSRKRGVTPPLSLPIYHAFLESSNAPSGLARGNEDANTIEPPFAVPTETAAAPVTETLAPAPEPKPKPRIQEIPDTVLKGKETRVSASRRSKPWEQKSGDDSDEASADKVLDLSQATPSVYANPVNETSGKTEDKPAGAVEQGSSESTGKEHEPSIDDEENNRNEDGIAQ
ncbi:intercellular trafficking and secretion [Ascosphaera pollenicola]|nr:intercellular trafficking and secretion [Ascosphaera pollenicola]